MIAKDCPSVCAPAIHIGNADGTPDSTPLALAWIATWYTYMVTDLWPENSKIVTKKLKAQINGNINVRYNHLRMAVTKKDEKWALARMQGNGKPCALLVHEKKSQWKTTWNLPRKPVNEPQDQTILFSNKYSALLKSVSPLLRDHAHFSVSCAAKASTQKSVSKGYLQSHGLCITTCNHQFKPSKVRKPCHLWQCSWFGEYYSWNNSDTERGILPDFNYE